MNRRRNNETGVSNKRTGAGLFNHQFAPEAEVRMTVEVGQDDAGSTREQSHSDATVPAVDPSDATRTWIAPEVPTLPHPPPTHTALPPVHDLPPNLQDHPRYRV